MTTTPSLPQAVLTDAAIYQLWEDCLSSGGESTDRVLLFARALSRMGGESVPAEAPAAKDGFPRPCLCDDGYCCGNASQRGTGIHSKGTHCKAFRLAAPTAPAQQAAPWPQEMQPDGSVHAVDPDDMPGQQAADVQAEPQTDIAERLREIHDMSLDGQHEDARGALLDLAAAQSVSKAGQVSDATVDKMLAAAHMRVTAESRKDMHAAASVLFAASAPTVGPDEFRCPLCFDDPANFAAQEPSAAAEPVYQLRAPLSNDWRETPKPPHMEEEDDGFGYWYECTKAAYDELHVKLATHKGRILYTTPSTPPSAPAVPTDAEILHSVRQLYASDEAAKMGAADDIRTARAVLRNAPAGAGEGERVYLVCTGEVYEGQETYTRHDAPVPMADQEVLYTRPPSHEGEDARDAARYRWLRDGMAWGKVSDTEYRWKCFRQVTTDKVFHSDGDNLLIDAAIDAARAGGSQ